MEDYITTNREIEYNLKSKINKYVCMLVMAMGASGLGTSWFFLVIVSVFWLELPHVLMRRASVV